VHEVDGRLKLHEQSCLPELKRLCLNGAVVEQDQRFEEGPFAFVYKNSFGIVTRPAGIRGSQSKSPRIMLIPCHPAAFLRYRITPTFSSSVL
jgi:hypothetical protein